LSVALPPLACPLLSPITYLCLALPHCLPVSCFSPSLGCLTLSPITRLFL
jgi:hypothetical protein